MNKLTLAIDGIMCDKCVKKVTAALMKNEDLKEVRISTDYKKVTVLLKENKMTPLEIRKIIEAIDGKKFKIIKK